jgi:hypothetical protein
VLVDEAKNLADDDAGGRRSTGGVHGKGGGGDGHGDSGWTAERDEGELERC